MKSAYSKDNFDNLLNKFGEVGRVVAVSKSVIQVDGLPTIFPGEILMFENGGLGQVLSVGREKVDVLRYSGQEIPVDLKVARTGAGLEVPVGDGLMGKSIDSLGGSLFKNEPVGQFEEYRSIETTPPGIEERVKIKRPLETGVSVVDLMMPLGMGQRELIIGDRKTGKTSFLLQTILNQAKKGTVCIYAAIGKKKTDILQVEKFLKDNDIRDKTIIVGASSTSPFGVIYAAPYSAMSVAEYFKDRGEDVLIILDDISIHARFYREISLLAKNFPGRNSYPGDIFYTHARLVERAGNFKYKGEDDQKKSISITCLPVAETKEGDISGYIQTNLMSMTDGHIFFDGDLFDEGRRPSVNYSLSVTRVGRQTQSKVRSGISRELSNFLSLYQKTQSFVHFGAELSSGSRATLKMGDKLIDFFNQDSSEILHLNLQIMLFCLIWVGLWNNEAVEDARVEWSKIIKAYKSNEKVRKEFAKYVSEASEFNALLGRVSSEANQILDVINSALEENVTTDRSKQKPIKKQQVVGKSTKEDNK